jgi:dsDNA-specific endonuclease/ATPase MutS2
MALGGENRAAVSALFQRITAVRQFLTGIGIRRHEFYPAAHLKYKDYISEQAGRKFPACFGFYQSVT